MSKLDYYKCDECGKILYNMECHKNQLMLTLIGRSDSGGKVDFCGIECLKKYVNKLTDVILEPVKDIVQLSNDDLTEERLRNYEDSDECNTD